MSSEDLQGLVGAGGQVVHADVFILAARCYHIPTERKATCWLLPDDTTPLVLTLSEKDGRWFEVLLVVLAPVTSEYSSRMFVLMEDFTIDGPDDTVVKTI